MYQKHKLLTLFYISILFLSSFEFTTHPINFSILFSSKPNNWINNNNLILVKSQDFNINSVSNKISDDLLSIIEKSPESQVKIIVYLNNDKLNKEINIFNVNDNTSSLEKYRSSLYNLQLHENTPLIDHVSDEIIKLGGEILGSSVILNAISVKIKAKNIVLVSKLPHVIKIEKNFQIKTRLNYSIPSITNYTGSDPAFRWNYNLYNGSGIIVGVIDTGIYKSHPALAGKVIQEKDFTGGSNPNDLDGHGTHVAGIIASSNSLYRGVAPGVNLINIKSLNTAGVGNSFQVIQGVEWALIENNFSIDILTMSAGATVEANGTNGFACFVDYVVKYYKVIWVNAAGNNGPSSKSLDVPADAYNCISVGNIDDGNNIDRSSDTIASSSSRGPTWDIPRIKPDIVAPGQNIISCNNGIGFVSKSGTSMATPHVAGAAALLWQYYKKNSIPGISENNYPMLIKAILLHTAEDKGTPGPDYSYGYGYLDIVAANKFSKYGHALIDSFNSFGSSVYKYKFVITKNSKFNISLLWYKDATYDLTHHLYTGWQNNAITNLNLFIENANFQTIASSASLYDNFENLKVNLTPGTYYIKVNVVNRYLWSSPEQFILISSAPLEKIFWLDTYTILFIVLIVGSVSALVILVIYYFKSGSNKTPDEIVDFGYSEETGI